MVNGFTAIDVETANADFATICQIGLVRFEEHAIVDEWQSLVNPEDYFSAINVSIHGITERTVSAAPTWPQLIGMIDGRVSGQIAVCHTGFDRVSLLRACERYHVKHLDVTWLDSARVARRTWPEQCAQRGYRLKRLCEMLSLTLTAHVAVADARAAGQILLRAVAESGLTVSEWLERVRQPIVPLSTFEHGNPDGPLAGNVIVFTGALSIVRRDAARMAASAGCDVGENVTMRTTLLVVGDQDIRHLAGYEKSSKHRKAEVLIESGQQIRIIGESDFRRLLAIEGCGAPS